MNTFRCLGACRGAFKELSWTTERNKASRPHLSAERGRPSPGYFKESAQYQYFLLRSWKAPSTQMAGSVTCEISLYAAFGSEHATPRPPSVRQSPTPGLATADPLEPAIVSSPPAKVHAASVAAHGKGRRRTGLAFKGCRRGVATSGLRDSGGPTLFRWRRPADQLTKTVNGVATKASTSHHPLVRQWAWASATYARPQLWQRSKVPEDLRQKNTAPVMRYWVIGDAGPKPHKSHSPQTGGRRDSGVGSRG